MGSPMYKIVLGMSYYIHSGGPGALVDGLRPFFKESTEGAARTSYRPGRAFCGLEMPAGDDRVPAYTRAYKLSQPYLSGGYRSGRL